MKNFKRPTATAMAIIMGVMTMPTNVLAASFNDIENHWGQASIERLYTKNVVTGYEDGSFKPDNFITRAETVTMINKFYNFTEKGSRDFIDVSSTAWYADQISIATNQGYLTGYADNTIRPSNNITRAEVAVILNKIINKTATDSNLDKFVDANTIPSWSEDAFNNLTALGLFTGYEDGTLRPNQLITRAELAALLIKAKEITEYQPIDNDIPLIDDYQPIDNDIPLIDDYQPIDNDIPLIDDHQPIDNDIPLIDDYQPINNDIPIIDDVQEHSLKILNDGVKVSTVEVGDTLTAEVLGFSDDIVLQWEVLLSDGTWYIISDENEKDLLVSQALTGKTVRVSIETADGYILSNEVNIK